MTDDCPALWVQCGEAQHSLQETPRVLWGWGAPSVLRALSPILLLVAAISAGAQNAALPALHVPARDIPVTEAVSPELQQAIVNAAPQMGPIPKTNDGWRRMFHEPSEVTKYINGLLLRFGVGMERRVIAGVGCFVLTPREIPAANRRRLLVHVHGGGFVFGAGDGGTLEGILVASIAHTAVVSIDYRMPPNFPYPAAIDDIMGVWRELVKNHRESDMAIFGSSAGGALTLCFVQRLIREKQPVPGAIAPGTPWSDLSETGDSYYINAGIDSLQYRGWAGVMAKLYSGRLDIKDPLVSPIYGKFNGFPPTILTSGTRDLLLSDTVRVNQKLREAGVETRLQVFEGMTHAAYLNPDLPESKEAITEIAKFFDDYLGR